MTTQPDQALADVATDAREPAPTDSTPDRPMAPPPKVRRRPMLWALGIALVALGGLGAAYVTTAVSDTQSVIVMRSDVDRGSVIRAGDLTTAQISADPALDPVAAKDAQQIIGQRASRDLNAGSLLSRSAVASQVIPAKGESLVGVALTAAQLPASGVRPGDRVRILSTPRAQDSAPSGNPLVINATVVGIAKVKDNGGFVVDVTVPQSDATDLAQLVATARVAMVVDGNQ